MDSCSHLSAHVRKPVDIVFLLQDLEFGGTQRYTIQLLKYLDRGLFSPHLWVLRGGMDMALMAEKAGVRPVRLSSTPRVGPHSLVNLAWRIFKHRPHILYTLTVVPNIWGRLFGTILKVPVIVTSWRGLFPKQYESLMWPLSRRIICNAKVSKEIIIRRHQVDPRRIVFIPNAVDTGFFCPNRGQKANEPTVLFVGRLVRDKDPLTLLEAFRLTARSIPDARLDIVGNGYLKGKLEAFIRRHSLEPRVRLLPGQQDIRPFLSRAWVFALASVRDASPNAVLEAMACGLPVVASRVGGIPELVRDGDTGIILEPANPVALANALIGLLENKSKQRLMGQRGRARAQTHYAMEDMVRETERVLMGEVDRRRR